MSRVELRDFLDAYLVEVDELLSGINGLLLTMDAPQRRREPTPRALRDLFRALHTIKGLSAMVGVEPVVTLAHRMEAAVRAAERSGGLLPPGGVDRLLEATRAIEQRLREVSAGRPAADPAQPLLSALEALESPTDGPTPTGPPPVLGPLDPAIASKLAPSEIDALARGVVDGMRAVCVRFVPSTERSAAGLTITTIRERLAAVAEILRVVPLSSGSAPAGLAFAILALTSRGVAELAGILGITAGEIELLGEPAPEETAPATEEEAPARPGTLRVAVERLDDVLDHLSALTIGRSAIAHEVARLAERGVDVRALSAALRDRTRRERDLRAAILRLRMIPVSEVLDRVPLVVRAARRATGRSVRLELDLGRAELDKGVAERVFPAIVHLVRNAIDHGIEPPDERARLGKPAEGVVRIEALARGTGELELAVIDDGRGVDPARVAARAGAPVPATDRELLALLCRPGVTTRDQATSTSGRGMGMDIVDRVVRELGGEISLSTTPGQGTAIRMRVPLSIAIVDALAFECGDQRFAVPLAMVDEIVDLGEAPVTRAPGPRGLELLERRGRAIPMIALRRALGWMEPGTPSRALVVRGSGEPLAFGVDRMLGQQEVVVRPLVDPLVARAGLAGATDLGDGRATLVLDLVALARAAA